MTKKVNSKPTIKIERFVPHQYISACNTSNFFCNKDLDLGEDLYLPFNSVQWPREYDWALVDGEWVMRKTAFEPVDGCRKNFKNIEYPEIHIQKGYIVKCGDDYENPNHEKIPVWVWDGQATGNYYVPGDYHTHISTIEPTNAS